MPGAFSLYAFLLAATAVAHARDILITVDNPNISWDSDNFAPLSPSICSVDLSFNEQCTDNWWFTNGTSPEVATWGKFVSMSFDFVGTSVEIGVEIFPGGGAFFADVDGVELQREGYSTEADTASTLVFPIGENLAPGTSHTVTVTYDSALFSEDPDARSFIAILGFVVRGAPEEGTTGSNIDFDDGTDDQTGDTDDDGVSNGGTGNPDTTNTGGGSGFRGSGNGGVASAADQTPYQLPDTPNKPLSPGAIGGLVGVILLAILLAVITALIYVRRQRRLRLNARTRAYMFGPNAQGMQEANIGTTTTSGTTVESPIHDEKPAERSLPKRPDNRVSSLYPYGSTDTMPAVSSSNQSRRY